MVINTNTSALSSSRLLGESSSLLSKSLARLSSGSKITGPEDDAAGMAVSMRFDAQVNRINAANNNVGNASSFNQTQDGFLTKVGRALDRMSELSVLSQDITKSDSDRSLYNQEFTQLGNYITDVAKKDFNGVSLFSGTAQSVTIDSEGGSFSMTGINLGAATYTTATASSVATTSGAATALTNVKNAIATLASDRATVGASRTRLNYTGEQLMVLRDNLTASNSRIKDVDVAEESTQFAKYCVLLVTDGVTDNLYDHELAALVHECVKKENVTPEALNSACGRVVDAAQEAALSRWGATPFAARCLDQGFTHEGGKSDDITIVIGFVSDASHAEGERTRQVFAVPPPYRGFP